MSVRTHRRRPHRQADRPAPGDRPGSCRRSGLVAVARPGAHRRSRRIQGPSDPGRIGRGKSGRCKAGNGHSSPRRVANRVYLLLADGRTGVGLGARSATGKELWRAGVRRAVPDESCRDGPTARARSRRRCIDRGGCTRSGSAASCPRGRLRTDGCCGARTSRRSFRQRYRTSAWRCRQSSRVTALILHVGGIARRGDGARCWRPVQRSGPGRVMVRPTRRPSSPSFPATPQVITQSQRHVIGLSLADGAAAVADSLHHRVRPEQRHASRRRRSRRLRGISKADDGRSRPSAQRRQVETSEAWQNADVPMYMSSPVASGAYSSASPIAIAASFSVSTCAPARRRGRRRGAKGENAAMLTAGEPADGDDDRRGVGRGTKPAESSSRRSSATPRRVPGVGASGPAGSGLVVKDADTLAYWVF